MQSVCLAFMSMEDLGLIVHVLAIGGFSDLCAAQTSVMGTPVLGPPVMATNGAIGTPQMIGEPNGGITNRQAWSIIGGVVHHWRVSNLFFFIVFICSVGMSPR